MEKALIMDKDGMNRAITRIAYEIIEKNKGVKDLALIGIQRRGVPLARRIAKRIAEIEKVEVEMGYLDITFYRDDLSLLASHPVINGTHINFQVDKKKIVLVDDVIYTGRTIRSAIDALFDLGRPDVVQLAVLVDRGHRELPFKPDYVGKNVPTSRSESISVQVVEMDNIDKVTINEGK